MLRYGVATRTAHAALFNQSSSTSSSPSASSASSSAWPIGMSAAAACISVMCHSKVMHHNSKSRLVYTAGTTRLASVVTWTVGRAACRMVSVLMKTVAEP